MTQNCDIMIKSCQYNALRGLVINRKGEKPLKSKGLTICNPAAGTIEVLLLFSLISGSRAVITGARIGRFGLLPTTLHRIGIKSTTVKSASESASHREAEVERKNVIADYLRVI